MDFQEYKLAAPLDRYIECVWFLSDLAPRDAPAERVLPDGCPELIVHLGDRFRRVSPSGASEIQPACFFIGPMAGALLIRPEGRVRTMGVRFRSGGARPFFHPGLDELTDATVPLDALWGPDGRAFEECLREARDDRARLALVEGYLSERLRASRSEDARVEAAVAMIRAHRGDVSIRGLESETGLSSRQLERRFRSSVGLGPKLLARIVRFQNVLLLAGGSEPAEWAGIAVSCGYFDQAHLSRDVREFAGISPGSLAAAGTLSGLFTSPERLNAFFDVGFFQDRRRAAL